MAKRPREVSSSSASTAGKTGVVTGPAVAAAALASLLDTPVEKIKKASGKEPTADRGQPARKKNKKEKGDEKRSKKDKVTQSSGTAEARVVGVLMEGAPGMAAPKPLPLSALTKHKDVAWQWMEEGKMRYPIPIGCSRPLSPFDSDE